MFSLFPAHFPILETGRGVAIIPSDPHAAEVPLMCTLEPSINTVHFLVVNIGVKGLNLYLESQVSWLQALGQQR